MYLLVSWNKGALNEERMTATISNARQKIRKEISELNERLKASKDTVQQLKAELVKLEQEEQQLT